MICTCGRGRVLDVDDRVRRAGRAVAAAVDRDAIERVGAVVRHPDRQARPRTGRRSLRRAGRLGSRRRRRPAPVTAPGALPVTVGVLSLAIPSGVVRSFGGAGLPGGFGQVFVGSFFATAPAFRQPPCGASPLGGFFAGGLFGCHLLVGDRRSRAGRDEARQGVASRRRSWSSCRAPAPGCRPLRTGRPSRRRRGTPVQSGVGVDGHRRVGRGRAEQRRRVVVGGGGRSRGGEARRFGRGRDLLVDDPVRARGGFARRARVGLASRKERFPRLRAGRR